MVNYCVETFSLMCPMYLLGEFHLTEQESSLKIGVMRAS